MPLPATTQLAREPGDKRTGTFTSGTVSIVGAWSIALYCTGWKHAGENIAEALKRRARELPAPIQMSDALSRNAPKREGVKILLANGLAHGRRQFVEVVENFPEECRYVLETLRGVYHNDALAREQELSPEDRLHFHQEHSGPLMKGLHEWMEGQLAEPKTEPNSGLGQAISYLLNHRRPTKMFRAGLYARVSTNDQQTLAMQNRAMREYAARRGWTIALQVREVNSGAAKREAREKVLEAARRRGNRPRAGLAAGPL